MINDISWLVCLPCEDCGIGARLAFGDIGRLPNSLDSFSAIPSINLT